MIRRGLEAAPSVLQDEHRQCRVTSRRPARVTPLADAEIPTKVELLTLLFETVKVALVAPAGTVTLAGTVAT